MKMKRNTLMKASGLILAVAMSVSVSMPVQAYELPSSNSTETTAAALNEIGNLTVLQETANVKQSKTQQTYTFSYSTALPSVFEGGSAFKIDFTQGFTAESLLLGNWSDYDGMISVKLLSEDSEIAAIESEERSSIDLSIYQNVTSILIETSSDINGTVKNIDSIKVAGVIDADTAGESVQATGSYIGYSSSSADDVAGTVFITKQITTGCRYFAPGKPQITLSSNTVTYQEELVAEINGITGQGNTGCNTFNVTVHVPGRMHITKVGMPELDNASCKLFIGDAEQNAVDGEVVLDSAAENLVLKITTDANSFNQVKPMTVSMVNSVNSSDSESVTVSASAESDKGLVIANAAEKAEIVFTEQIIQPEPNPEPNPGPADPEPDLPDVPSKPEKPTDPEPVIPSLPDTPSNSAPESTPGNNNVLDFTGLNIQSAVAAASGNTAYDFTGGNSNTQSTSRTYDFSLYDSVIDDNVTSSVNDSSSSEKESPLTKDIEEKNSKEESKNSSDSVANNRFVQFAGIAVFVIAIGGSLIYLMFKPKKNKEDSEN
ncbi:hypothetical protein [Blautia producta]|uniref:hypothetical protein n=1 Tax=Blautia producta TaxID=33035 RepID=UPI0035694A91